MSASADPPADEPTVDNPTAAAGPGQGAAPVVSVLSGSPTAAELAAVVTVLLARAQGDESSPVPVATAWNAPGRRMRALVRPGPRAWRRAALPR